MEWTADALVLGARPHGEGDVILEVMTRETGRHLGLVRGGRSPRRQPVIQPGNTLKVTWRARLDSQLGRFTIDLVTSRAASLMTEAAALHAAQLLTAHLRLLPERDPHPGLHDAAVVILDHMTAETPPGDPGANISAADRLTLDAARLLVAFELTLLEELGFGLDLQACAATGETVDLAYVSPKSGRAVSRGAGAPYHDRLLALPTFLAGGQADGASPADLLAGLRLTGHFLDRHVMGPRAIPPIPARSALTDRLASLAS